MKKKDKIIQESLSLFNELGVSNVSTNLIAEKLKISVGNLYYYFKNKEEIVHVIFEQYALEVRTRIVYEETKNIEITFSRYVDNIFLIMWKYRFFYLDMFSLLQSDSVLRDKYLELRIGLSERLTKLMEHFIQDKIVEINESDILSFVEMLKFYCTCWMNYEVTFSESGISKSTIYRNIIKLLFLFKIVATDEGRSIISNLERKYLEKMVLLAC